MSQPHTTRALISGPQGQQQGAFAPTPGSPPRAGAAAAGRTPGGCPAPSPGSQPAAGQERKKYLVDRKRSHYCEAAGSAPCAAASRATFSMWTAGAGLIPAAPCRPHLLLSSRPLRPPPEGPRPRHLVLQRPSRRGSVSQLLQVGGGLRSGPCRGQVRSPEQLGGEVGCTRKDEPGPFLLSSCMCQSSLCALTPHLEGSIVQPELQALRPHPSGSVELPAAPSGMGACPVSRWAMWTRHSRCSQSCPTQATPPDAGADECRPRWQ